MKKLDTSAIAPGISFKPKGGTLAFLQLSHEECFNELVTSRIGSFYDPTKGYILNGCINSGSGSNYIISAGSFFFSGEIYLVPAATFTLTGSNVAEGVITITQFTADADPSIFTDGGSRNVHNIRQIVFQNGLAGSGAFDFVNAVNLAYRPVGAIGQTIEWLMPGSGSQNTLLGTYFDPGTLQGIHPLTLGWIIDDGGSMTMGYLASDPVSGTIGSTGGADSVTLTNSNMPTTVRTDGVNTTFLESVNSGNAWKNTNPGGGTAFSILNRYKAKLKITRYA